MKAMLCKAYGPPESLVLEDHELPPLGPDEVRVRVRAAGVNFPDILQIEGKYQYKPAFPFAPGSECAGDIIATGSDVTDFEAGDRVIAMTGHGAFAEEVNVRAIKCMPLPDDMPPISFAVEVEPVGLGDGVMAGQVAVVRPGARDTAPPPRARFEGGLELLAGELAGDRFRAGHPLVGSLSWRAASPPGDDYELLVRLTDLLGREVARNQMSLGAAGFPTSIWLPDDRVAGRLSLLIPADLRGGTYRVQIGLLDAGGAAVPVSPW